MRKDPVIDLLMYAYVFVNASENQNSVKQNCYRVNSFNFSN